MKTIILPKNVQRFDASTLVNLAKSQSKPKPLRNLRDDQVKRVQYRLNLLPSEFKMLLEKDFRKHLNQKQIGDLRYDLEGIALADYSENKFVELATKKIQDSFPAEALAGLNLADKSETAQTETTTDETLEEPTFYEKNKTYIMIAGGLLLVGGLIYYFKKK